MTETSSDHDSPTTSPLGAVERLRDAINAHDLDAMVACFAPDYRGETPTTPDNDFVGTEHVRRNWAGMFAKVPDIRFTILRATTDGDTAWAEVEQRGTEPDGRPHHARGVVIAEVAGGLMTHNHLYLTPVRSGAPDIVRPAGASA